MSRWDIQAEKPYSRLSKKEKASDMEQVDRYWPLIEAYTTNKIIEELERMKSHREFIYWGDGATSDLDQYLDNRIKALNHRKEGSNE
jgi:hypothetical protein